MLVYLEILVLEMSGNHKAAARLTQLTYYLNSGVAAIITDPTAVVIYILVGIGFCSVWANDIAL